MKIYLLMNNCPQEFAMIEVIEVFLDGVIARQELARRKRENPYQNQYYELVTKEPFEIKECKL